MVKILLIVALLVGVLGFSHFAEARGRYGSLRVGGYTSSGKGSHYVGGFVRSTPIHSRYR